MKNRSSTKTDNTRLPLESRKQSTAIRIHLTTGILLVLASAPSLLTGAPNTTLNYIGNIITLVMGSISLTCAWISYRFSYVRGSLLFASSVLLISLGIPVYANGLGVQAGIIVAVSVISVAVTTLPPLVAIRVGIAAIVLESGVIFADLFLPDFGLEKLESEYISPVLLAIVFVFTFFVFRQFSTYAFRAKLILVFVSLTALTVSVMATAITAIGRSGAIQQSGNTVSELADRLALDLGNSLAAEIDILEVAGAQFEEGAALASASYGNKSEAEIIASINTLDTAWKSASDSDAIIQNVLDNQYSSELTEFQRFAPQHVEVFITDRYGANIGATNRTSDYFQADEEWWQEAYNDGEGAIFISQPEFDESSNTFAVLIALPLHYQGDFAGILRSTLTVNFIAQTLTREGIADVGLVDLRISDSQLLSNRTLSAEEIAGLNGLATAFDSFTFDGIPSLVSTRKVFVESGKEAEQAISKLNWSVIAHRSLEASLQPIENQRRATVVISMASLLFAALLGYLAAQRMATPIVRLRNVASQITTGNLDSRAEVNTQDEIGQLAESFNEMANQIQGILRGLELRVAERTSALDASRLESEKRANDLLSISEISRIINTEKDLDILLPLITRLVSEKFGFYHAGIFLLDETKQFAKLQAANSEGGQRMLFRGHKLAVGQGIVGTVALEGKPHIALDVGADAVFFDNPDLPATRSEMSLPLKSREQVIGVLDVQSQARGEFTNEDLNVLGILADQISVAIENARLFARTDLALNEIQGLYNQYLQKEWKNLQLRPGYVGYRQTSTGGAALKSPLEFPEAKATEAAGKLIVSEPANPEEEPSILAPINLRGQVIGILNIKSPTKNRKWTQEEISLIQSVTDRLAIALENARLFEETKRRAERERLVSEIAGKIRSVNDPQTMIQMAAEELRNVLGANRVQVMPNKPDDSGGKNS
jgi:GAF domain-containing protein/HAMP domain-containing protein